MTDFASLVGATWPADVDQWRKAAEASLKGVELGAALERTTVDDVAYRALEFGETEGGSLRMRGGFRVLAFEDAAASAPRLNDPDGGLSDVRRWADTDLPWAVSSEAEESGGAGYATQVGALLARVVSGLRAVEASGGSPEGMTPRLVAVLGVDGHTPTGIAAVRALRAALRCVGEALGVDDMGEIHGVTSARMMSAIDPDTNMIRNSLAAFTAAVGGADAVIVRPHDPTDPEAVRIAANVARLLLHEARLDRPADAAAGAPFFEALTRRLAQSAWAFLQELEAVGGAFEEAGRRLIAQRTAADWAERVRRVKDGRELVGVTAFPPPTPRPAAQAGADAIAKEADRLKKGGRA